MTPTASEYFDLDIAGPVTIVRVVVDVIRHPEQAMEFGRDLNALVDRDGLRSILINLKDTHYLGSTAFGALIGVSRRAAGAGGRVAVCELHPDLVTGANIIGLGMVTPVFDTEAEALASF